MLFFGLILLMSQISSAGGGDEDCDSRIIAEGQDAPGAAVDSAGNDKKVKETVDLFAGALDRRGCDDDRFVADCTVALDMNEYPPNNKIDELYGGFYANIHGPCPGEGCTADDFECCISVKISDSHYHSCVLPFEAILLASDEENEDEFARDVALYGCDSREGGTCDCLLEMQAHDSQGQIQSATFYLQDEGFVEMCGEGSDSAKIMGPIDFEQKD